MVSWRDQEVEELCYPERLEIQQKDEGTEDGGRDGDECDYLVFESGVQRDSRGGGEEEEKMREDEVRGGVVSESGSRGEEQTNKESSPDDLVEETSAGADGEDQRVDHVTADSLEEFRFLPKSPERRRPSLEGSNLLDSSETPTAGKLQEDWTDDSTHPDDLSDCLQAELAVVYSDSEAGDDQWTDSSPRDITNQAENCGAISERGMKVEESGEENQLTLQKESEAEEKRGEEEPRRESGRRHRDDEEQPRTRREGFLRSPSVSSTASSIDPEKRVKTSVSSFVGLQ